MMERHPLIGDVRGLGLFLGIELVRDRTTGERAIEEAEAVMYAALSRGLSFKLTMGNILTLTPALTITREEMDRALDIIEACLERGGKRIPAFTGITALASMVAGAIKNRRMPRHAPVYFHSCRKISWIWKGYPMTIITCSVSTVSLALTLISFTVPSAGA